MYKKLFHKAVTFNGVKHKVYVCKFLPLQLKNGYSNTITLVNWFTHRQEWLEQCDHARAKVF